MIGGFLFLFLYVAFALVSPGWDVSMGKKVFIDRLPLLALVHWGMAMFCNRQHDRFESMRVVAVTSCTLIFYLSS